MKRLRKKMLGGTSLVLSLLMLSACGSEAATTGSSVDTSALQEKIAGLEKKLVEQGAKSVEQEQKIAALETKLNELSSNVVAVGGAGGQTPAASGNNGSAGKGDGVLITFAQYEKLEVGMTVEEVIEILGGEGEALSEAENMVVYNYKGTAGNGANAVIAFQSGKLLTKAQSGLK